MMLGISVGERVWILYVDLVCLDLDGNITDVAVSAMISALENTTLPEVKVDSETGEISCSRVRHKLKILNKPVSSSFVLSSNPDPSISSSSYLVTDPTEEEEELSNCVVSIVTTDQQICHVLSPGGELLTPSLLQQAISLSLKR